MDQGLLMAVDIDMDLLEAALNEIRPALQADGGDLILHGIDDDGIVSVELLGACGTCPLSIMTMVAGIDVIVRRRVPGVAGVMAHSANLPQVIEPTVRVP
jgi:Fe-S cluster biogenesis protein NfuA